MTARVTFLLGLLAAVLGGAVTPGHAAPITFPTVQGKNLEGQELTLPADFAADAALVFVAFQREQQAMVDTWIPAAKRLMEDHPGLRYYELPTISPRNRMTRWFIHNGMRRGIPDADARAATITLYLDKARFRATLNLPHEETIYALLLDRTGAVRWSADGPYSEDIADALAEAVRATLDRVAD